MHLSSATRTGARATGAGAGTCTMATAAAMGTAAARGDRHRVGFVGDAGGEGLHITEHLAGEALNASDDRSSKSRARDADRRTASAGSRHGGRRH